MPTPQFGQLDGSATYEQLRDYVYQMQEMLQWLLRNLDTLNIKKLNAKVIEAGTVTAEKMNVTELSAIAADLGTITAGEVYGAYIATANGTFPRIEFSSVNNLLAAYFDADSYVALEPDETGLPAYTVHDGGILKFYMNFEPVTQTQALISLANFGLVASLDLDLRVGTGYSILIKNWSTLKNKDASQTLQQALDAKQNTISGATGSFASADGKTVSVSNGIITSIV